MVASASICSETRMVPSSVAIAEPARPVTISAVSTGANSRAMESAIVAPTSVSALKREKASETCREKTAPAKKAVSTTTESDPKPIASMAESRLRRRYGGRMVSTSRRAPMRAMPPRSATTWRTMSPSVPTRRSAPRPRSPTDAGSSGVDEDPRDTRTDPAEDLVVNGTSPGGQFVGADLGLALRSQEHRLLAHARLVDVGDVDHALIHAHGAGDRHPPAADQHLTDVGEATWIAVGVTDRQRGDDGWPLGHPARSVAHRRSRGHALDVGDPRRPAQ